MSASATSSLKKRMDYVPNYGSSSSLVAAPDPSHVPIGSVGKWRSYLASEVDASKVTPPLSAYAFVTGYIDAISFSSILVWVGFQTGNFTQLALGFARALESHLLGTPEPAKRMIHPITSRVVPPSEQQAICSITAFVVGVFVFGRLGDRIGTHKRVWLVGGTLLQALLTLASAITFRSLEYPPIHPDGVLTTNGILAPLPTTFPYFFGVACLSASLGLQGFMARRLATQFSTTIVLTTVFVELATDPALFQITRSVQSRDQKWFAVLFVFLGAVAGRLILGQLGTAATLGVAVIIRVLIAFSWLLIPARHIHLP